MSDPAAAAMKAAYAKVWTRANPFPSAQAVAESEAFLSSLDSLTTRLAASEDQLTQAREALEKVLEGHGDPDISCEDDCYAFVVRQALATINEGETARERAIRKAGPGYNPFMTARVEDGPDEPATINREGETEA